VARVEREGVGRVKREGGIRHGKRRAEGVCFDEGEGAVDRCPRQKKRTQYQESYYDGWHSPQQQVSTSR